MSDLGVLRMMSDDDYYMGLARTAAQRTHQSAVTVDGGGVRVYENPYAIDMGYVDDTTTVYFYAERFNSNGMYTPVALVPNEDVARQLRERSVWRVVNSAGAFKLAYDDEK